MFLVIVPCVFTNDRSSAIDNLTPTLEEVAKTIEEETGTPVVICAGGAQPQAGGAMVWSQLVHSFAGMSVSI